MAEEINKKGGIATHAVEPRPVRPPTSLEVLKNELNRDYSKQVTNYFMGDKEKAMKFMSAAIYSIQKTPKLLECDKQSLMTSLMTCAEYGLYPSNASGEAFILPYAGKAQFQLGYQGVITLLYGAGVQSIQASIIREKDKFEYEEGLEPRLIHKPDVMSTDRGRAIGAYAVAVVNNQKMFKVMNEAEIMRFKEFSKAKGSEFSPWNSNDPELWMWKKTVIRQLAKILPKNERLMKAFEADNEDSNIPKANLDAGGPAVPGALHEPTTD